MQTALSQESAQKQDGQTFRIERVNDIQEILKCMPFEREIRKKGRDDQRESSMLLFVQGMIGNPSFGFWIAYDSHDAVLGYCIAALSYIPGKERLIVIRLCSRIHALSEQLQSIMIDWGRKNHLRIAQIIVTKNIKAMKRLFGVKPVGIVMERRI